MTATLCQACEFASTRLMARLPGSIHSPKARALQKSLKSGVNSYFVALANTLPMRTIQNLVDAMTAEIRDRETGEITPTNAKRAAQRLQRPVARLIGPAVDQMSPMLQFVVADHVASGYWVAAKQVEAWVTNNIAFALDTPYPTEVFKWADAYGARQVTKMDETTKKRLSRTIARQMADTRRGVPDVGRAIRGEFQDMTRHRSELIANTEMNFAVSRGSFERHVTVGASRKDWVTVGDDRVSKEICEPNGGQGEIPIAKLFGSGDMTTPGHPRCRCTVAYLGITKERARQGMSDAGTQAWLANVGKGIALAGIVQRAVQAQTATPVGGAGL